MLEEPRCIKEGWAFINEESESWELKSNAPNWAKEEFQDFINKVNPSADEDGVITYY